jgi:hypothetical protein
MDTPHPCEARAGLGLRLLRAAVFTAACVALSAAGHGLASGAAIPWWTLACGLCAVLAVAVPLAGRQRSLGGIVALLAVGQVALHTLFGIGQHDMAMPHSTAETSLVTQAARLMSGADAGAVDTAHGRMVPTAVGMGSGTGMDMAHPGTAMAGDASRALGAVGEGGHPAQFADGSHPLLHALSLLPSLPSLPMLLSHVLAAVIAGWLLRRGDLAVFRLVALSAENAWVRALHAVLALVAALRPGGTRTRFTRTRPPRTTMADPLPPQSAALQHSVIRRGPPPAPVCVLAA